jgi:phage shock protein E
MTIVTWIIIVGAVAAFLLVKRLTQATPATAREWLNKGALVIDVRSEAEFRERHLPGAINIPLNRLGDEIARHAPNKEQPLLLHCLSGTRSGMGTSALKKMGYHNVFNLGSYGRAGKIVGAQK